MLTLQDHNTRVVVLGTALLGAAAGAVGSFVLLRKRALIGDALAHATLPGVALAFIATVALGFTRASQLTLLLGATVTGLLGVAAMKALSSLTRIKDDAAMAVVLSVFYGAGVALLSVAQRLPGGNAAGLESFIYGKTASMVTADALLIGVAAAVVAGAVLLLFKELTLLSFDPAYAAARGYPVGGLDAVNLALVVAVTVIGLQAVGLILVIALLIIPAAAARFWTDRLHRMVLLSAGIGTLACLTGALASALVPKLPSGAAIVLTAAGLFFVSMMLGTARGLLPRLLERHRLSRRELHRHVLRSLYELTEPDGAPRPVAVSELLRSRAWPAGVVRSALRRADGDGLVAVTTAGVTLTPPGLTEAARITREHRLWELYLVRYADVAPSHVDRDADAIEHVLTPEILADLEQLLAAERAPPPSPHPLPRPR